MIGQTISHYRILEKLGEGGMGVVYRAHDTTLDRDVALKFLPSSLTGDSAEKERFYHEARAAAALTHQNIAVVHEIGEHDGQLFIAMEYIEGENLKSLIGSQTLPTEKILDIAIQACEGLKAAHQKKIVHRDIKSANIMLTPAGQIKITDFGLAKVQGATKLTMTGSTIGTAAYMSPEQARGEEVNHRSDIFSFGVVLYELLARRLPFRGEHPAALMYSIVNEDPQPISKYNDRISPEIEQIVGKALAKDREERYQDVGGLLTDLRIELKRLEHPEAGIASTFRAAGRPRRRLFRIGITAAAIIALAILALIFNPFNLKIGLQQNNAEPRPSLAVISFENIPDPADSEFTGEMLTNLLITAFFQTKDLDVVSRERLYDIQRDIGEGASKVISSSVASQIARRAGVSTMMIASIIQLQPTLTVTYRVIDVETGKIINSQRVSGYTGNRLALLADTLALMVKRDLHVTPAAGAASVADVTTKSPEAYRAYVEGLEYLRKPDHIGSIKAMLRAIALDSTFAMPHYQLGVNWSDQAEVRKAWELRANATEKDRLMIEAQYLGTIGENPSGAVEMLEQVSQKYPHEQSVYLAAGYFYAYNLCNPESAIRVLERGLRNDSSDQTLLNQLGYWLAMVNRRTEAIQAMDTYLRLAPTEFNAYDSRGDIYLYFGEIDSAIDAWGEALVFGSNGSIRKAAQASILRGDYPAARDYFRKAAVSTDVLDNAMTARDTILISIHKGRLLSATQITAKHLKLHRAHKALQVFVAGNPGIMFDGDLFSLFMLAYETGRYPEMLRHARERSEILMAERLTVPANPWERHAVVGDPTSPICGRYDIAWALLKNGNIEESTSLMEELKSLQRPGLPARQREYDYFSGLLALERGQVDVALEQFRKSMREYHPNRQPQYHYAVALLKSGNTAEAITEFQRLIWMSSQFEYGFYFSPMATYWPVAAVKAHYWLGVAYEQQGKRGEAIKEYETFLDIWKNADFKSAEMQDARTRLAALKKGNTQ